MKNIKFGRDCWSIHMGISSFAYGLVYCNVGGQNFIYGG